MIGGVSTFQLYNTHVDYGWKPIFVTVTVKWICVDCYCMYWTPKVDLIVLCYFTIKHLKFLYNTFTLLKLVYYGLLAVVPVRFYSLELLSNIL